MTSTALPLRDYQEGAIDAVWGAWHQGLARPAVVLPTGAGKTVVFSHMANMWRQKSPSAPRVIVLVHRDELADQARNKLRQILPAHVSVGKVKANDNGVDADVMVCSVQTLSRERRLKAAVGMQRTYGTVGLIITDECHHAVARSYRTIFEAFPSALHMGVTATLERGDGVGLGDVWQDVVYQRSVLNLIGKGHLVSPRALTVTADGLDLAGVGKSRGDYAAGSLGDAMLSSGADHAIAAAYKQHASDRPGVIFTPTVATAEQTASTLADAGFNSAVISGATPREDRQRIFDDYRTGQVQILVNCMVLTEGFDAPWASCAVIARPTLSQPLYVQMVGRVLRPWAGKTDALVLNLAGAGGTLRTLVDLEPGVVETVEEGESLTEAVDREEKEGNSHISAGHPAFGLKFKEVDLFKGSSTAWLRTDAGVMFISTGADTVFLWPGEDAGTWDVCRAPRGQKWVRTGHTGLDLSLAMAWAEAEAEDVGSFSVRRTASWRRTKPSTKQLDMARSLGIPVHEGATKADVSDLISVKLSSRVFDRYVSKLGA